MLAVFAILGIPASTTHAITGTIMGAGAARRVRAVRWRVSRQIIFSWIITIPGAARLAIAFTYMIHLFVWSVIHSSNRMIVIADRIRSFFLVVGGTVAIV